MMRNHRLTLILLMTAGLASAGPLLASPPAQAATPGQIVVNAKCSGSSWANLQVGREDNGKLSIDFGVDMAIHRAGVVWKATVKDNTLTVFAGQVRTIPDGSFSVTRLITPLPGTNKVTGSATNPATGETCRVTGSL
jgi:hypothetical protein